MPAPFSYGVLTGSKGTEGSIRSWVNYELLDVEGILLDAQAFIYGLLRAREMKSTAQVALAATASTAPLPTGFLDPLKMSWNDGYGDVLPMAAEQLLPIRLGMADSTGALQAMRPAHYAIMDEALTFDAQADAACTATLLYYKRPTYLGAQHQTNFLTDRYPHILRRACLMYAADDFQDDPQFQKYQSQVTSLTQAANAEADLALRGAVYNVEVR